MSSTSLVSLSSAISNRLKLILSSTQRRNEEERGEDERLLALPAVAALADLEAQRERGWAGAEPVGVCPDAVRRDAARLVVVRRAAADLAAGSNGRA
jgi:hypothetical protein